MRAIKIAVARLSVFGWLCLGASAAQQEKFELNTGLGGNDSFGQAVALSEEYLLVGASTFGTKGGAAFLYNRGGQFLHLLEPDDHPLFDEFGGFGGSVAIDKHLAVGSSVSDNEVGLRTGAVYLFAPTGEQLHKLTSSDGQFDERFGSRTRTCGDRLIVLAPLSAQANGSWGAVYVFDYDPAHESWRETYKLVGSGLGSGDSLVGIALTADLICFRTLTDLFIYSGQTGEELFAIKLPTSGTAPTTSGLALDETTIAVGGDSAVHLYSITGALQETLSDPSNRLSIFGRSIALAGDRVFVGAHRDNGLGSNSGAAYVYEKNGSLTYKLTASNGGAEKGFAIDLAARANDLLVGSHFNGVGGGGPGSAFLFDVTPDSEPSAYCVSKVSSLFCFPLVSYSGLPSASAGDFLLQAIDVNNGQKGLLFYGFETANLPFQGGTLCVQPPLARTSVQNSGGSLPPAANCTGTLSFDFGTLLADGSDPNLTVGESVYAQFWFRDPGDPTGFQVGLSNALSFEVGQ